MLLLGPLSFTFSFVALWHYRAVFLLGFSAECGAVSSRFLRLPLAFRSAPLWARTRVMPSAFSRGWAALAAADVQSRVITAVKGFEKVDATLVNEKSHFVNDLGLDSLDVVEVVMSLEDEFAIEIPDAEADKIQSVAEAIRYVMSNPHAK
jgi:NADH dehydrogenase (ubiquinone) 1 alpha/beta subcomplex 1